MKKQILFLTMVMFFICSCNTINLKQDYINNERLKILKEYIMSDKSLYIWLQGKNQASPCIKFSNKSRNLDFWVRMMKTIPDYVIPDTCKKKNQKEYFFSKYMQQRENNYITRLTDLDLNDTNCGSLINYDVIADSVYVLLIATGEENSNQRVIFLSVFNEKNDIILFEMKPMQISIHYIKE